MRTVLLLGAGLWLTALILLLLSAGPDVTEGPPDPRIVKDWLEESAARG